MGYFSSFAKGQMLKYQFDDAAVTRPTTWYISIHSGDPSTTGANEFTGGSYVRKAATFTFDGTSKMTLDADVTFDEATTSPGDAVYFGVWDASSSGNFLGAGANPTPNISVVPGVTYTQKASGTYLEIADP